MKVDQQVSHYQVIEKLGGGGMGIVYKARDMKLDRFVALKFLPHHMDSEEHQMRFIQEAKTASALDHPNICTIYEIDKTPDGQVFIAMGFYEGETLKKKLSQSKFSLHEALQIALQVTRGLSKAHEHGVIHRDIKPANVIITQDGVVKIVDFGLARFVDDTRITHTGIAVGTLQYMSPEQVRGKQIDHRTDIWSVGVLLYEMVSGRLPFSSTTEVGVIQSIINEEPTPIRTHLPNIPEQLEKVIRKTLSKPVQDRYVLMQQLAHELEGINFQSEQFSSARTVTGPISKPTAPSKAAEKRQLAVVVSRLSNYYELIEEVAPEKMETFINQIHEMTTHIAGKHAGIVNKFTGEEIVTVFGLPASQEDDFVRAIRFAIEAHAEIKNLATSLNDDLTIGFHSGIGGGSVVTEWIGSSDQQYHISGPPVQVAMRLADEASTNEILVSSECLRLIGPYFETKACDPIKLQGKKEVVPYSVLKESGLQSRLEAAEKIGFTPYTGRQKELDQLKSAFETVSQGGGHLVTISGEAGIGKSRLLFEFREFLNLKSIKVVQGRAQSYGTQLAYSPFVEALRDLLIVRANNSDSSSEQGLVFRIKQIDQGLTEFIPIYLNLLSVPTEEYSLPKHLTGEDLRLAIQEALLGIFTCSAKSEPLVLFFEDWQWADETSDDVLKQIVESLLNFPILIVITTRPEKNLNFGNLSQQISMRLAPLESSSSKEIIQSIIQANTVPETLIKTIHDHTGGNPFFLEELCNSLIESGKILIQSGVAVLTDVWENVRLPETVEAVIRTRLDRLSSPDREVLRVASVAGREFSRVVLQQSIQDQSQLMRSLESLKSIGLIQQMTVVPEATYKFKHALTRQVVYESILPHQRKLLHNSVADSLERLYPDRKEENSELLANHFSQAEDWKKAAKYGLQSAQKVSRLGQFTEAFDLLQKAHSWLSKIPPDDDSIDTLIEILLKQERLCETLGNRAKQQEIINELLKTLFRRTDQPRIVEVYCRQADLYTIVGQYNDAEQIVIEALRISKELNDLEAKKKALRSMGFNRWHQERYEDAASVLEEVLAIGSQTGHSQEVAGDLTSLGNVLRHQGKFDRALNCLEQALEIYESQADPAKQCLTLYTISSLHSHLGNDEKFLEYMERCYDVATKSRLCIQLTWNLLGFAKFHQQHKNIEKSLSYYKDALELGKKSRYAEGIMLALGGLTEALIVQGRDDEALVYLKERANFLHDQGDFHLESEVRKSIASLEETHGNLFESVKNWNAVRDLKNRLNDEEGELEALESLARLCRVQDSFPHQALEFYQEALLIAQKKGDRSKEGILLNSIAVLEWTRADYRSALQYYRRALNLFQDLRDKTQEGVIWNSLGVTFIRLGEFDDASKSLRKGIEINQQTGQRLLEAHSWAGLGEVCHRLGKLQESKECYETSLEIRLETKDRKGEGWMLYELARIHGLQKEPAKAKELLSQATGIAIECSDKKLKDACKTLQSSLNQ